MKYQARDGWGHRDALRLAHPKAPSYEHDVLFRYATLPRDSAIARVCTVREFTRSRFSPR